VLLAARYYAATLSQRTPEEESKKQIRELVLALASNDEFAAHLRDWSRWAWGRQNPMIPRDSMRVFAEELFETTAEWHL
jgi:hypothetical protein